MSNSPSQEDEDNFKEETYNGYQNVQSLVYTTAYNKKKKVPEPEVIE